MHSFRHKPTHITPTTTSSFEKIRGFTLTLMETIGAYEYRVRELSDRLERQPVYIRQYLYNLRRYGLAQRNQGFWSLTQNGLDVLYYIIDSRDKVCSKDKGKRRVKEEIKKSKRRVKEETKIDQTKLFSVDQPLSRRSSKSSRGSGVGRSRQSRRWWRAREVGQHFLDKFMKDNYELEKKDLVLVRFLWRHYQRYGQQFVFLKQVELDIIKLGIRQEELTGALQRLTQYNVLYVVKNNKVGIKVPFIEQLVGGEQP